MDAGFGVLVGFYGHTLFAGSFQCFVCCVVTSLLCYAMCLSVAKRCLAVCVNQCET